MSHFDEQNDEASNENGLRTIAKCQCGGCNRFFSGMGAFDAHRIGPSQQRRCMTEEELRAAGMAWEWCFVTVIHENKRSKEKQEVWYDVAKRDAVRQAFTRMPLLGDGTPADDSLSG